jgi:hypothetical protein
MQAWRGWTTTAATPSTRALTWAEWCAWKQRTLRDDERQQQGVLFTARESTHLSFVRWLYQTGRLEPREYDNV